MLKYIIEFLFCSGLFIALYKLLIESRVSHSWARRYLLITMFVSLVIPTLELPLYPAKTLYYEIPVFTPQASLVDDAPAYLDYPEYTESAVAEPEEATYDLIEESHSSPIDWSRVLICSVWAIYFIITALNLARFAWRIYVIVKLRRRSQLTVYELYTLAVSEQVREPFSFWRTIFMNRSMLAARESEQVIIHELSHIRHHHTTERLALELLRCVAWFNPFVWLAGSALVEVHEWQADSDVLNEGYDVLEYRQLIFQQLFGYKPDLTNGLGSSQPFKKRFIMMTDFTKGKYSFLRLGATLPLVAAMILAFGAVRAETEIIPIMKSESSVNEPTTADLKKDVDVVITSTGEIKYNDEILSFEEFKQQLATDSETISTLNISTEEGAKMGALEKVKLAAREAQIYKVRYVSTQQTTDIVLPPLAEQSQNPADNTKVTDIAIANRNHLPVCINANNKVMTRRPNGDLGIVEKDELVEIIKSFVNNTESVDGKRCTKNKYYSDFEWTTISVGENGERHYPESQGLISIVTDTNASAEKFIEVQQAITAAHNELRNELAQEMFKKPFASLDADDSAFIRRAIPMKVYEGDTPFEKMITLNQGTYTCVGYGLSDRVNQAETAALTKSVVATTFKVVSDTEIDVTTDAGWDFLKSGRYTYTLTKDSFTLKNKDASYSFKCEFTGPLFKAQLKLIFDKQHEYFRNLIVIGPTETKDKEVRVSFGPNGTVYFNGEQTTIEELREKHYMNFNAPIVQSNGTLDGNMEDVIKEKAQQTSDKSESQPIANPVTLPTATTAPAKATAKGDDTPFVKTTDIIRLTVDGDKVTIKEDGNSGSISFELSNLNSGNILTILQQFITQTASSRTLKLKWAGGKEWSYPASNAVIVVDAKNGASVADVRRVRDWARYAVTELRNRLSLEQVNVLYFYLCEHDCNLIELAVPTPVFITQNAQNILDLSPETDVIYSYVEQSPRFQGKQGKQAKEAFLEWMQSQKELYNEIFKNKPASYIYPAQFVIEKDGSVHLLSGLDRVLNGRIVAPEYIPIEPIERLCAAAPKWTPAKRNGEPVRTQLTMYMSHRNDVRFGGWNSYHHSTTESAPRGVIENPQQNANDNIKITKITLTDEQTVVDFRIWGPPTYWVRVQNNTALITGDARYPIRNVYGTKMDTKYWIPQSGDGTFQLIFPPINCKVDKLSFFEDSWRINDIDLSSLQNSEQNKPYIPRFADGEYRPIGLIKKHSKEKIHGLIYHLPTIKVKGNKIIVEGTRYKGFIKPGEYDYRILEKDMLHLIGDGIHYITSYEYSTLSTGANMLDIMMPINVDNTQIKGVMYIRQEWED